MDSRSQARAEDPQRAALGCTLFPDETAHPGRREREPAEEEQPSAIGKDGP